MGLINPKVLLELFLSLSVSNQWPITGQEAGGERAAWSSDLHRQPLRAAAHASPDVTEPNPPWGRPEPQGCRRAGGGLMLQAGFSFFSHSSPSFPHLPHSSPRSSSWRKVSGLPSPDSSWTHRLPVSFSPAVVGGAVEQPAAAAGRRPGSRRAAGALLRRAAARRTTEDLAPLDAVAARCRALQGREGGWDEEEVPRFSEFPHFQSDLDLFVCHLRLGGFVALDRKWSLIYRWTAWNDFKHQ